MGLQALSYVSQTVTRLTPGIKKPQALIFTVALIVETCLRKRASKGKKFSASFTCLSFLHLSKYMQSGTLTVIEPLKSVSSLRAYSQLGLFYGLSSPYVMARFIKNVEPISVKVEQDRPLFFIFLKVASEMCNIAAKVLGSLETGMVVQQMIGGKSDRKIQWIVSTFLLGVSAWNIYNVVEQQRN